MKTDINFPQFLALNSQFNRKTLFDVKKIEYNDSSGSKKTAINRNWVLGGQRLNSQAKNLCSLMRYLMNI